MDPQNFTRQKGLTLLIFVIILALGSISYFMTTVSQEQIQIEKDLKTRKALKKAKEALLTYAMNYADTPGNNPNQGPGNFPCPDEDLDGDSETNTFVMSPQCNSGGNGVFARIPWQELGMNEIRDGNNELLWYAVSNNFADFAGNAINTSTVGEIAVKNSDGVTYLHNPAILNGAIAVIISPGKPIVRQDGVVQVRQTIAEQQNPVNYLDIAYFNTVDEEDNSDYINSDPTNGFISGPVYDAANNLIVNDMVEVITYEDLEHLLHARVANDLRDLLNSYGAACNEYPFATTFDGVSASKPNNMFISDNITPLYQGALPIQESRNHDWGAVGCASGSVLPTWFVAEEWHRNTWYATASVNPPCVAGVNCLEVQVGGVMQNNVQTLVIFAGRALLGVRPSSNSGDYFEGENFNPVDRFFDADQNDDYLWIIATSP